MAKRADLKKMEQGPGGRRGGGIPAPFDGYYRGAPTITVGGREMESHSGGKTIGTFPLAESQWETFQRMKSSPCAYKA